MAEIDKAKPNQFEEQGMNPFNAPTPGESLTRDPEQKFPRERPPEINDVDTAIKEVFVMLTERKSLPCPDTKNFSETIYSSFIIAHILF